MRLSKFQKLMGKRAAGQLDLILTLVAFDDSSKVVLLYVAVAFF